MYEIQVFSNLLTYIDLLILQFSYGTDQIYINSQSVILLQYSLTQTWHLHACLLQRLDLFVSKLLSRLQANECVSGDLCQRTLVRHTKLLECSLTVFKSDKLWVILWVTYSWLSKSLDMDFFQFANDMIYVSTLIYLAKWQN